MPELRFETHFQSDGLPISPHQRILVAVSGGSDSLALLHLLHDWVQRCEFKPDIHVATVDHGLRAAAADEAEFVANTCMKLGYPHSTLKWERTGTSRPNAEKTREARYALLCDQAGAVGATTIMLGHTMDDQAETVVMRARRSESTRGLSGIPALANYASANWPVSLHRPLLNVRRKDLQAYLKDKQLSWISDPSNENLEAERVRVRQALQEFPDQLNAGDIARLANLSARGRAWLSRQAADFVKTNVSVEQSESEKGAFNCSYRLAPKEVMYPIVLETFATLIMAAGGKTRRVPLEKIEPLARAYQLGQRHRLTLGRCLVTTGKYGAKFERENRNTCDFPASITGETLVDGRFLLTPTKTGFTVRNFIVGLERFLPVSDFPLKRALYFELAKMPHVNDAYLT